MFDYSSPLPHILHRQRGRGVNFLISPFSILLFSLLLQFISKNPLIKYDYSF